MTIYVNQKMKYIKRTFALMLLAAVSCKQNTNNRAPHTHSTQGMVSVPSGILQMGGDNVQADKNEYPKHAVKITSFFMDMTEVTNAQFMEFVDATGYKTIAERPIDWDEMKKNLPEGTPRPHDSIMQPGALVFSKTSGPVSLDDPSQWWQWTIGANWRHPLGPNSDISKLMDHPVVQLAWADADAYCKWAGKRLPTEAEWEWAARGGQENMIYPWGSDNVNEGSPKANFFQGFFPFQNTKKDGYELTAPVKSFPPNGYGLYDMAGNVWEWCQDWFDFDYYKKTNCNIERDTGPNVAYNPYMPFQQEKVIRGGSFLCNDDYCSGYRVARRMGSTTDTGLNHTGCRCVKDSQ